MKTIEDIKAQIAKLEKQREGYESSLETMKFTHSIERVHRNIEKIETKLNTLHWVLDGSN